MALDVASIRRALQGRTHQPASARGDDRYAAVATILRERNGQTEVLLIRRAQHERDPWSGHMALPGGRQATTDPSLLHTALRETQEEVGIALDPATEFVARLDDTPAVARGRRVGIIIAPFVFVIARDPTLLKNPIEVDEVLWTPLAPLVRGECNATVPYEVEGQRLLLPAFDVSGRLVWGLTHQMLSGFFQLLDGASRTR